MAFYKLTSDLQVDWRSKELLTIFL